MAHEVHDNMLMEILTEKKTLAGFLDSIFGFLSRRTDFYVLREDGKSTNIGLNPGTKEEILMHAMRKYEITAPVHVPVVEEEVEVCTSAEIVEESSPTDLNKVSLVKEIKPQTNFLSNEYYNGSVGQNYCWSQSSSEIEIYVILPTSSMTSKDIQIKIESDFISIRHQKKSNEPILEGKMHAKCKHKDAVWSISSGKLHISLDKMNEIWWSKLLVTEDSIDIRKIDCSKPIEEYSEESQALIEKLKWDEKQKLAGAPTSDDLKHQDLLRKAWNAENSPFKGQPFDPSLVKFH